MQNTYLSYTLIGVISILMALLFGQVKFFKKEIKVFIEKNEKQRFILTLITSLLLNLFITEGDNTLRENKILVLGLSIVFLTLYTDRQ